MAGVSKNKDDFDIAIPSVPVTEKRRPFIQKDHNIRLEQPGTARANIAPSTEAPRGTLEDGYAHHHRNKTVLQQHAAYFDFDNDGVIWPCDTFYGFRRLGFALVLSFLGMFVIHLLFSYPTQPGFLPDPSFRIYLDRIHNNKHGSDSNTYDFEGRYEPQKFEDIFAKYAHGDKLSITLREILHMLNGQRGFADPIGWFIALFECEFPISRLQWSKKILTGEGMAVYIMLWPADGRLKKDDIRRVFDGSIFYEIYARRSKRRQ